LGLLLGIILATMYGVLTSISGVLQLKEKQIPFLSAVSMFIFGALIVLTALLIMVHSIMFTLLLFSLLVIHIVALINGFYLFGRINISHHFFRLVISLFIIVLIK